MARRLVTVVSATMLATLVVGVINIGRSFNYDEAITYLMFVRGGSLSRALETQFVFNNHQLFSVTQALAWRMGIVGESAQRLVPVTCGAATVGLLTWWVGRRTDAFIGCLAGLFLLVAPAFLEEFRTLRGYSLATLMALTAAIATHRSWSDHRARWSVLAATSMVVAVATHAYSGLPLLLIAVVTAVMGKLRVAHVLSWLAAAGCALLLQRPILDDARAVSAARGSRYISEFGEDILAAYLGNTWLAASLTVLLCVCGVWSLGRRSTRVLLALGASIAIVIGIVVFLWQVVEPFDLYPRFFVSLTPYVAALMAYGVHAVRRPVGAGVAVVIIVMAGPHVAEVVGTTPTIRDAAGLIDASRAEGLAVCGSNTVPLGVYTTPVPTVDPVSFAEGGPDFSCDVYVAVIGIGRDGRTAASSRFDHVMPIGGGVTLYSDAPIAGID